METTLFSIMISLPKSFTRKYIYEIICIVNDYILLGMLGRPLFAYVILKEINGSNFKCMCSLSFSLVWMCLFLHLQTMGELLASATGNLYCILVFIQI